VLNLILYMPPVKSPLAQRFITLKSYFITLHVCFQYLDRRCVTEAECYMTPKPSSRSEGTVAYYPFRPVGKECLIECPATLMEKPFTWNGTQQRFRCEPCQGMCKKECEARVVDSIAAAQVLMGCTHITGSGLEIHLRHGGNRKYGRYLIH